VLGLVMVLVVLIFGLAGRVRRILTVAGCAGWFREVLLCEHECRAVFRRRTSGFYGTAGGGAASRGDCLGARMASVQTYSISGYQRRPCRQRRDGRSVWYLINLLAVSAYSESVKLDAAKLYSFHPGSFKTQDPVERPACGR
jgi:hypothetical protein